MHRLLTQLTLLYPILDNPQHGTVVGDSGSSEAKFSRDLSRFLSNVQGNTDKKLLFHKHTPS
jgi:hypothetical protein